MSSNIEIALRPGRIEENEWESIVKAIDKVLESGIYIGGEAVSRFENQLAAFLGKDCIAVSTGCGQDSLVLSLLALDLPKESLIITPPNDGGFSSLAVQESGYKPLVVDVDLNGLISVEVLNAIPEKLQQEVAAIIVTHLHGQVCDMLSIVNWAHLRGIKVIEDCSQSIGAEFLGRKAGTFGDMAVFSFYPTKNLGALGDGGALVTRSETLAEAVRELKQYGWKPRFHVSRSRAINSRMDAIQAAILCARFPYLEINNKRRRALFDSYVEAFPNQSFLNSGGPSFIPHHIVILIENRDQIAKKLLREQIHVDVHYPYLNNEMLGINAIGNTNLPNARFLSERILSLPSFPTMTGAELEYTISMLRKEIL
jgi:dTDP-4-amino-4,6-dideoxygalactose transaminase